ncbi:unnamed protein product, partial [Amoebophrya sp. A25]
DRARSTILKTLDKEDEFFNAIDYTSESPRKMTNVGHARKRSHRWPLLRVFAKKKNWNNTKGLKIRGIKFRPIT